MFAALLYQLMIMFTHVFHSHFTTGSSDQARPYFIPGLNVNQYQQQGVGRVAQMFRIFSLPIDKPGCYDDSTFIYHFLNKQYLYVNKIDTAIFLMNAIMHVLFRKSCICLQSTVCIPLARCSILELLQNIRAYPHQRIQDLQSASEIRANIMPFLHSADIYILPSQTVGIQ